MYQPYFFTLPEFYASATAKQHNIINYPDPSAVNDINRALLRLVEKIMDPLRAFIGLPIYITSGYRCELLNTLVGGSPASQHMTGQACDFTVPNYSAKQMQTLYYNMVRMYDYDQLIYYPRKNIIHVSYISIKDNRRKTWISGAK